jgi:hypothetical protein
MPFLADKEFNRQMAGREPASDAEEHSPVMFIQILIIFFATVPTIISSKL